jgi:hypothetical protein
MRKSTSFITKNIDNYINNLPDWSKKICIKLRDIIHKADPELVEMWKWNSPSFGKKRMIILFWAFSKSARLTFFEGALMKDPYNLFAPQENNLRNRSIYFTDVSQVDENKLIQYVREAVKNDEEGKTIKIPVSKNKTVIIPKYIKDMLKKEELLEKYNAQIYTYRKGYVQWIEEAKQEETKQKRITKMIEEVREGNVYMGMKR